MTAFQFTVEFYGMEGRWYSGKQMENKNSKKATTQVSFWCGSREGGFRVQKAHVATMAVAFPFQAFYLLVLGESWTSLRLPVSHGFGFKGDLGFVCLLFCGVVFPFPFLGPSLETWDLWSSTLNGRASPGLIRQQGGQTIGYGTTRARVREPGA